MASILAVESGMKTIIRLVAPANHGRVIISFRYFLYAAMLVRDTISILFPLLSEYTRPAPRGRV
jgi:hypothetical protein